MKPFILILFCSLTAVAQSSTSVISTQPAYGNFNAHYAAFDVNGETQQDHVVRWGWNCAAGGGAVVSGLGAFCSEYESYYRPGGPSDGRKWFERHEAFYDYNGGVHRPISIMGDGPTGNVTMNLQAWNLNFLSPAGSALLQVYSGLFIFQNGAAIRSVDNGVAFIQQASTTGSMIYPIYVDNTNSVLLGNGVTPVKVGALKLKDGSTYLDVTIDPTPDKCGTGYHCLRVPN